MKFSQDFVYRKLLKSVRSDGVINIQCIIVLSGRLPVAGKNAEESATWSQSADRYTRTTGGPPGIHCLPCDTTDYDDGHIVVMLLRTSVLSIANAPTGTCRCSRHFSALIRFVRLLTMVSSSPVYS